MKVVSQKLRIPEINCLKSIDFGIYGTCSRRIRIPREILTQEHPLLDLNMSDFLCNEIKFMKL